MEVVSHVERVYELRVQLRMGPSRSVLRELLQRVPIRMNHGLRVLGLIVRLVEAASICESYISFLEIAFKSIQWLSGVDDHVRVRTLVHHRDVLHLAIPQPIQEIRMAAGCIKSLVVWAGGRAVGALVLVSVFGNSCLKAGYALLVAWTVPQLLGSIWKVNMTAHFGGIATGKVTDSQRR